VSEYIIKDKLCYGYYTTVHTPPDITVYINEAPGLQEFLYDPPVMTYSCEGRGSYIGKLDQISATTASEWLNE
jgi:hypothetical protein